MTTHGRQPNVGKERTGTSSPAVPRQTRAVPASSTQPKTTSSKLTSSSSSVSRNPKPTGSTSPSLSRGRSFDNKSSPSNAPLQKSHSTISARSTKTVPVVPKSHVEKSLVKSQARSSSMNQRQGIGTVLNKKPANSNVVVNRKVKSVEAVKAPVIADEKNHDDEIDQVVEEGLTVTVDSDRDDDEQQGIREEEEQEYREEEEEGIDEETSTHLQMGEEKEEQINMNEEDQSENKIETSPHDDLTMDVEEQINNSAHEKSENSIETIDHHGNMETNADPPPPTGEDEPIDMETNADPPMGEEEQIKIDDEHPVEEDQVQDDPIKEKEGEIQREIINPEETVEAQEKQKQEPEPEQEETGEKFLKATEIMKLMEAQTSGKDLTSASPRQLIRGGSGINRGSFNKKEVAAAPAAAYNEVIEETASKLISEKRRNKVLALAGAFETVISLQQD